MGDIGDGTRDRHGVRADLSADVYRLVQRLRQDLRGSIRPNGRVDMAAVARFWEAFGREISALYRRSLGARVNVVFRLYLHVGRRTIGFVFRLVGRGQRLPLPVEAALMGHSHRLHDATAPSGQPPPATMIIYPRHQPALQIFPVRRPQRPIAAVPLAHRDFGRSSDGRPVGKSKDE